MKEMCFEFVFRDLHWKDQGIAGFVKKILSLLLGLSVGGWGPHGFHAL